MRVKFLVVELMGYNMCVLVKLKNQGFTVVELLIVIAIIGILAAVVLGSVTDVRDGGLSAKVQIEMDGLAKRAATEESQAFTYDMVCGSNGVATSTKIMDIIDSIESIGSSDIECNSSTMAYAVAASLSNTTYWCIDSQGTAGEVNADLGGATTCPAP